MSTYEIHTILSYKHIVNKTFSGIKVSVAPTYSKLFHMYNCNGTSLEIKIVTLCQILTTA